jgi:hypothetical protein
MKEVESDVSDNETVNLLKGKIMLVTQEDNPKVLLLTIRLEFERSGDARDALVSLNNYVGQKCGAII